MYICIYVYVYIYIIIYHIILYYMNSYTSMDGKKIQPWSRFFLIQSLTDFCWEESKGCERCFSALHP